MTVDVDYLRALATAAGYGLVREEAPEREERAKVSKAKDAYDLLRHIAHAEVEYFVVLTLNHATEVISQCILHKGTLNSTIVSPRDVLRKALEDNAAAVIVAHNHPSGTCYPSGVDREITKRLREACRIMGVELLDHIVLTVDGYYSVSEEDGI